MKRPSHAELVALLASLMATHALSIDCMLPALPTIGEHFRVVDANRLQWIVTLLILGSGIGQLFYGPVADRFGRKRVLLLGLGLFAVASLAAASAASLDLLLMFRLMQGLTAAAAGVIARAVVRDLFAGEQMARIMSSIMMVFIIVPVLAPSLGQALLPFVGWRGLFVFLALAGLGNLAWVVRRLPETLPLERRQPLAAAHLLEAARFVLTEPTSILYTLAMTALFGSLLAFVSLMPQIFVEYFARPQGMPLAFAACTGSMGLASLFNSRLVERVGMHRMSHTALLVFLLASGSHAWIASSGTESVGTYILLQAMTLACYALAVSNFGAIAMQPMARIAGSAASLQGVISLVGGAGVASLIGQQWRGSVAVLPVGAFCCGLLALGCVLAVERRNFLRRLPGP